MPRPDRGSRVPALHLARADKGQQHRHASYALTKRLGCNYSFGDPLLVYFCIWYVQILTRLQLQVFRPQNKHKAATVALKKNSW